MSKQVDERVVSMQFDNKNFERNVQTTLGTLDKLKQSLNLSGATKGLENVDRAAKKVDMTGLANAAETVRAKFSALEVMGVTALANITNSAVNAGKRIVSALTIDPIKTGFQEYETQINAVQTILANTESKGTTLQQVNSALDTLNTYADKTIYNFTEMTKNIGTFTAAGVDLDTSVSAIQGIANLAAVSGSTSQQASTAMYQLSQALSSGRVSLQDWNSVVNAGMGGQVFQDALKTTAKTMGIAVDESVSFRESISTTGGKASWLTSDVLLKTLQQFTMAAEEGTEEWEAYKKSLMDDGYTEEQALSILKMANTATDAATKVKTFTQLWDTLKESVQSGWTQSWEIIVGDFGEAKEFLTDISNRVGEMIGASADARNAMLSGGLSSGWKQLLKAGIADEEGYKETLISVAKDSNVALDEMIKKAEEAGGTFEDALADGLKSGAINSDMLSESVHRMTEKMSTMSSEELKAAGYTVEHVEEIKKLSAGLKDGTVSMDEFVKKISRPSGRENIIQSLWNAFDGLMSVIEPIKEAFREIFPPITGEQLYALTEMLVKFTEKLTLSEKQSDNLKRTFKGVFAVLDIGVELFKALGGGLLDLIGYITPASKGFLDTTASIGDFLVSLRDSVKEGDVFNKVIDKIAKAIQKVRDFLKPVAEGVKNMSKSISEAFEEISGKAKSRFEPLTALGNFLKATFVVVGKLVAKAMPLVVSLAKGVGSIFTSLMEKISSSIQGANYQGFFDILNGGIFAAIGAFIAKFIKSGGDILDNAGGILENIKEIIGGVGDALGAFTQQLKAKTLKEIATAIAILAGSLLVISMIDSEKLTASLLAITAMFAELMGSLSIFSKMSSGKDFAKVAVIGKIMKSLATSLLILAVAMKIMGSMSWQEMGVGLISMGVGLGALIGTVWALPEKKLDHTAKAIKKLSSSLIVLAVALKIMGSMSWQEMGVGLISMTAALGAMIGVVWALPKEKELASSSKAISSFSKSLVVLAVALKIMGSMSWQEMGIGLISMAGALGAMIGVVWALPKDIGNRATGILTLSAAMVILASALKIMGSMSWEEMIRGLATMALSLGAVIGVVWALEKTQNMQKTALSLIVLSSAMVILASAMKIMGSMSWDEIVRGLVTLAGALTIIGVAGWLIGPLAPAILSLGGAIALLGVGVLAAGVGVLAFAAGLTALGAALAVSGAGIVTFVASIIGLIPFLIEQVGLGIIKLCEVIAGSVDAICAAVTTIILAVVDALVTCIPAIAEGAFKLIVGLLEVLIEYLPQIAPLLVDLFVKLIDLIVEYLPTITEAVFRFIGALLENIAANISQLIDPLVKLFGSIFEGIAAVIGPVVESVIAPLLEVVLNSFVKLFEVLEPHIPMICELIAYLVTTITDGIVRIFEIIAPYMPEVTKIVEIIADAVTKIIDDIVRLFEEISPILDSISEVISETGDAIKDALDGVAGIIDSVGGVIESWFDGISGVIDSVGNAALNAGAGFEKMANGIKTITNLKLADMVASLAAVATGLGKISKHADGVSKTGTGMKKIADSIKISETSFNKAASGITTMTDKLSTIGPTMTTAIAEFKTGMTSLSTSISSAVVSVQAQTASMTASITSMCSSCVSAVKGFNSNMNSAGRHLVSGLAAGIRANKSAATSAAREVASAVESIIRSAWQVNSPSKLFYKIALGVGEGITGAFGDSVSGVKRSALDLSDTASDGFRDAMRQIAEFINSDMDTQPTIRPVLDLSEVAAGAGSISGMFGTIPSIDVLSNVRGIGSVMSNRIQNGANGDVVAALKDLKSSLNGKTGNSYNINGVTYNEGSDVAEALKVITRAIVMEGRT